MARHGSTATGGPPGASRSFFRRLRRLGGRLVFLAAVALVVLLVIGKLPSGTNAFSLVVRAAVGLAVGLLLLRVVRRSFGALVDPPPPAPATVDAEAADVVYVCQVCGTRLRLEVAATGKAPRHCAEEMEPKVVPRRGR